MRRALLLALVLLLAVAAMWLALGGVEPGSGDDAGRSDGEDELRRDVAVLAPPVLVGHDDAASPDDRAFPDLPPQMVPEGVGVFRPGARDVVGLVMDLDGHPVHTASVKALDEVYGDLLGSGHSTRDGTFWVRLDRAVEHVRLEVGVAPAYREDRGPLAPRAVVGVVPGSEGLEVVLPLGAVVNGTIVDEQGRALKGKVVVPADGPRARLVVFTRSDGRFEFVVEPGPLRLCAQPNRRRGAALSPPIELTAPASNVRVVCPPGEVIRGRIEGDLLRGCRVEGRYALPDGTYDMNSVRAREDGTFELKGLPPGPVRLLVRSGADAKWGRADADSRDPRLVHIALRQGLEIHGTLLGAEGRRMRLMARSRPYRETWGAHVDADGSFEFRGLAPGPYTIEVEDSSGRIVARGDAHAGTRNLEIDVR